MRLTGILASALSVIGLGIGLGILFTDNLTPACIGLGPMSSMPTHQVSPYEKSTTRFIIAQIEKIKIGAILRRLAELKFGDGYVSITNSDFFGDLSTDKSVNKSVSVIEPIYSWMEGEGFTAFDELNILRESILNEPSDCPVITGGYFSRLSTVLRLRRITREKLVERIESIALHLDTLRRLQNPFKIVDPKMNQIKLRVCQKYVPDTSLFLQGLSDGEGRQSTEATELLYHANSGLLRLKILCLYLERSETLRNEVMDLMRGKVMTITKSLETIERLEREVKYASEIGSWESRKLDKKLLEIVEREIEYFADFFTDF